MLLVKKHGLVKELGKISVKLKTTFFKEQVRRSLRFQLIIPSRHFAPPWSPSYSKWRRDLSLKMINVSRTLIQRSCTNRPQIHKFFLFAEFYSLRKARSALSEKVNKTVWYVSFIPFVIPVFLRRLFRQFRPTFFVAIQELFFGDKTPYKPYFSLFYKKQLTFIKNTKRYAQYLIHKFWDNFTLQNRIPGHIFDDGMLWRWLDLATFAVNLILASLKTTAWTQTPLRSNTWGKTPQSELWW